MSESKRTNARKLLLQHSPEDIGNVFTRKQLAAMYLELIEMVFSMEEAMEKVYTHSKSLEIEKNVLQWRLENDE